MSRILEFGSQAAAQEAIAEIDALEGLPKVGLVGPGSRVDTAAAQAWIDAGAVGDPPPGVTLTWATPIQHPTQPGRWAVPVDDARLSHLEGKTLGGRGPIRASDATERTPDWVPESQ